MSNVLSYQFIPVPTNLKKGIRSLKGNFYRVMDLIIDEIFAFKDTREKLTKEFAYRYVAEKLEINFGNVGRIFRQLQERGFIEILKIGKNKTGSLIRLIFGCTSTTKASSSSCTGTTEKEIFSCTGTTIKELKSKEKDHQEEGQDLLKQKGYTEEETKNIISRITASIAKFTPKYPKKYLLQCCRNEPVKIYSAPKKIIPIEKLQEPVSAKIELEKIKKESPEELQEIILKVNEDQKVQKSLKFFSSEIVKSEILASHYLAEFKKKYVRINS
jgi:hypothetical protein